MGMGAVSNHASHRPAQLTLVREANHRFANHLSVIVAAVSRQLLAVERFPDASLPQAEVKSMFMEIASTIYAIANLNRLLAQSPLSGEVDLGELLRLTVGNTACSLGLDDRIEIALRFSGDLRVSHETAHAVLLIVSEAVMNAVKYTHPAGLKARITLNCERTHHGHLLIALSDNGAGLPEHFDTKHGGGMGFRLMRTLAQSLSATLTFDSTPVGLSLRLDLPASSPKRVPSR